jgi:ABC-2 type transport system ATP-binding protein
VCSYVIEAQGLVKQYPRGVRALDGLSLAVPEGTLFGLLGPNGAGKSTTVRVLTTLARADSGRALVGGYEVTSQSAQVRRQIGVVGQRQSAVPLLTARENVTMQGRMYGLRGRGLARRADEMLARLGLDDVVGRQVGRCSGGMRRRVDIAMGLVHSPAILFLDEPTTGLDPDIRLQLWADLSRLVREDSLTILLTTHYLEEADRLAQEVAIIDHGQIITAGRPSALKQQLRGDALHVELASPPLNGEVGRVLATVPGVSEYRLDGTRLYARADNAGAAVPLVLAGLEREGLQAATVVVARSSLDDVYLRHTGRHLSASAAESSPGKTP